MCHVFQAEGSKVHFGPSFQCEFVLLVLSHELQFTVESFSQVKDQSC